MANSAGARRTPPHAFASLQALARSCLLVHDLLTAALGLFGATPPFASTLPGFDRAAGDEGMLVGLADWTGGKVEILESWE